MSFSTPPQKATLPLKSFTINTPQSDLDDLKTFLRLTRVPKETYENTQTEDNLGITRRWFEDSKKAWEGFDWYALFTDWTIKPCVMLVLDHLALIVQAETGIPNQLHSSIHRPRPN